MKKKIIKLNKKGTRVRFARKCAAKKCDARKTHIYSYNSTNKGKKKGDDIPPTPRPPDTSMEN